MSEQPVVTQPSEAGSSVGSHLEPVYTRREMMLYSLNEGEITTISNLNDQATLGYAIGSFFFSQALAISITSSFSEKLTPAGELALSYGVPFFVIIGVVGVAWGFSSSRKRNRFWSEIKQSSRKLP